ncbi:hypothetical protein HYFRA_00001176 [Hymenoscyphus fraxineus]|uniref:SHSP domain-containing protein n=1 Tax=Hymenoscyphus fraxineus TaxID=746836 RepID=A0A9N9PGZ7_9HELO|nr:hypothetical protein HYFRA_00001176 [Hymenoscyphus fraxineus]
MPFFPQAYLSPDTGFFQLLSELDQASNPQPTQKQAPGCATRCHPRQHQHEETFTPRFDVTETATSYELFGELPGLEQKDLNIEFTDAQTIAIKGKTVRAGTSISEAETTQTPTASIEAEKDSETSSVKSHSATVEDDYDEADTPLSPTPATTTTVAAPAEKKAEAPKPKFWVSERKVGSFSRSFSFSHRIEHDGVQASLKNGILHVVVPKVTKSGRIAVNVY